jgi:hypothetical protein
MQPVQVYDDSDEDIAIDEKYQADKTSQRYNQSTRQNLKPIFFLQIIIIILLLMNMAALNGWFATADADIVWAGMSIDKESKLNHGYMYSVVVSLRNVGEESTWVYIWGEVYESDDGSEPGEEMINVIKDSNEIRPHAKKDFLLGEFKAINDYSYYIRFHVLWDDKELESVEVLTLT